MHVFQQESITNYNKLLRFINFMKLFIWLIVITLLIDLDVIISVSL